MVKKEQSKKENLDQEEQEESINIEEDMVLVKNPAVTIREEIEEDGKYILFNSENEFILVINPTGKYILENCRGDKTVTQIVQDIKNEFTIKEDMELATVVKGYMVNLLKGDLIRIKSESD
jgi:hypothetical protein